MKMKKNKKYKRTLREDIQMIIRGYKLIWRMSPAIIMWRMAYVATLQISPYFALYMSALLIDELTAGASTERLLTLAVITVVGSLLVNIFSQNIIGRQAAKHDIVHW